MKLIAANWKMNPESEEEAKKLLAEFGAIKVPVEVEAVVCPPETYLALAEPAIRNMALGAQNVFWENGGAATGEISPAILRSMCVKYVIVGHSERREKLHESDEEIWRKTAAVIRDGLIPILCIGEPLEVRRAGEEKIREFLEKQLLINTATMTSFCQTLGPTVIAYEPVWAISTSGTGLEEEPEDAAKTIAFIKQVLKERCGSENTKVLYGGSVNKQTAAGFLKRPEIDGALVGHASLNAGEFQKILESAG